MLAEKKKKKKKSSSAQFDAEAMNDLLSTIIIIMRAVSRSRQARAPHTAYGDAPNNVQQISKYKIMVRNHGHGHINHLIIISYHIVSCHYGQHYLYH